MSGHGWVVPNPDGSKARCGGPAICPQCRADLAEFASRLPSRQGKPAALDACYQALAFCQDDDCSLAGLAIQKAIAIVRDLPDS